MKHDLSISPKINTVDNNPPEVRRLLSEDDLREKTLERLRQFYAGASIETRRRSLSASVVDPYTLKRGSLVRIETKNGELYLQMR